MRNQFRVLVLSILFIGATGTISAHPSFHIFQNDLLAEYEQKFVLIEKQFADYKKQIDPKKMSDMDVKLKVGGFENNRNTLKAKLRDLRKSSAPLSETDRADLDKRFEALTTEFEQLKKATE
jgi:hypothetical protein